MKYRLILDFGNTLKKVAVFDGQTMLENRATETDIIPVIEELKQKYKTIEKAILCNVVRVDLHFMGYLKSNFNLIHFNHETPIPLINQYLTPQTLGKDRLAVAIGAHFLFPSQNLLIIDAGSSITYDLVSKSGEYLGGAISLGIRLKARALNQFTDMLPLALVPSHTPLVGNDTMTCLNSGILNGTIAEVNGMIENYKSLYDDLKIILTGGDVYYFEKSLKYNIFAAENLVLTGLNYILQFNEQ